MSVHTGLLASLSQSHMETNNTQYRKLEEPENPHRHRNIQTPPIVSPGLEIKSLSSSMCQAAEKWNGIRKSSFSCRHEIKEGSLRIVSHAGQRNELVLSAPQKKREHAPNKGPSCTRGFNWLQTNCSCEQVRTAACVHVYLMLKLYEWFKKFPLGIFGRLLKRTNRLEKMCTKQ